MQMVRYTMLTSLFMLLPGCGIQSNKLLFPVPTETPLSLPNRAGPHLGNLLLPTHTRPVAYALLSLSFLVVVNKVVELKARIDVAAMVWHGPAHFSTIYQQIGNQNTRPSSPFLNIGYSFLSYIGQFGLTKSGSTVE